MRHLSFAPKGYLCLVLHAHLPFVRHPEEEYFLEENWLYEAITETYIPLLQVFNGLLHDGIQFRLTMSLTPPLVAMLKDELLQERYILHLNRLIELSKNEIVRTKFEPNINRLAKIYHDKFTECKRLFVEVFKRDIIHEFKKIQETECLEIITSCATHGFLPILSINPKSVAAQIAIGVESYKRSFDQSPRGIWLPECGYFQGLDELLKKEGIRYFFIDTHGINNAEPTPRYGVFAPIYCNSGVAAFGRDTESSKQVWSAQEGYPGDVDYREYYRDIGFDLDFDYIKPYVHPMGIRVNTGIKYCRITGKADHKDIYNPDWAREKAASHASNFMFNREKQIEHLSAHMERRPIVVAPYDAELYGHWWYEGPMFLDFLIRKIAYDQKNIALITPSEYLEEYTINQVSIPSGSSWGYKGYNEFWLDGANDWIYKHIHNAGRRMTELSKKFGSVYVKESKRLIQRRALNQAARELLLAEASDWPFIMKTGTMVPYANRRIRQHIGRFTRLYDDLVKNKPIENEWLQELEKRDNIFADIECGKFYLPEEIPLKKIRTRKLKAQKTDKKNPSGKTANKTSKYLFKKAPKK